VPAFDVQEQPRPSLAAAPQREERACRPATGDGRSGLDDSVVIADPGVMVDAKAKPFRAFDRETG
jgi:hypothetical protein